SAFDRQTTPSARGGALGEWLQHQVLSNLSAAGQILLLALTLAPGLLLSGDILLMPLLHTARDVLRLLFRAAARVLGGRETFGRANGGVGRPAPSARRPAPSAVPSPVPSAGAEDVVLGEVIAEP